MADARSGCGVCGHQFQRSSPSNIGGLKCARCGSPVEHGFDFCPICGQNQRERFARPDTRVLQVSDPQPPATQFAPPGMHAPMLVSMPSQVPPPLLTQVPPAPPPPLLSSPPADRTQVAPTSLRRPEVGDDDRTIPAPARARDDDPTHPRAQPGRGPGEDAPTTSFDPRQVAAATAAAVAAAARHEDNTREGVQPMGPTARAAPSQPVVGQRGQASSPTQPGAHGPRLVLVARDGSEGDKFAVVGDRLTLGRRAADVLFADDDFLSPTHARIERAGDHFWLVDTGSTNGVFLRVRGTAAIYPGDSFMVGHQLLRIENVEGPAEEQPPDELGTRMFGTPLQPAWGRLVVVGRGGIRGDSFGLRGARVVVGRESGDLLFPSDPFLSREHARLRLELNGAVMAVFLEDLNSANGTYIRIRGAAELHNKDTFRIGDQIIRLRLD